MIRNYSPTLVAIDRQCPLCGMLSSAYVFRADVNEWHRTHCPIQEAFPSTTPDVREIILSGLCVYCQEDVFADTPENIGVER